MISPKKTCPGDKKMKQISRRGFVKVTGALAAAPALASLAVGTAAAQAQAPNNSDLNVESNIVFGKGGDIDLLLDVYRPPAGVTPKRMAIIHLFGGGFTTGSKNSGYIVNDIRALGRLGYTGISANYRLQGQALWPAQINDTKAAIRWVRANASKIGIEANRIAVAGYSAGGLLALLSAGTNGMAEFEGNGGNDGVSSEVQASIGVYPLAETQTAARLFPTTLSEEERNAGNAGRIAGNIHREDFRADDLHPRNSRHHGADVLEHRLLHETQRGRCADGADAYPGSESRIRQQRT
jgi:acetyl esterase/lipase